MTPDIPDDLGFAPPRAYDILSITMTWTRRSGELR